MRHTTGSRKPLGRLETTLPLHTGELVPRPGKAVPPSVTPRRGHFHKWPVPGRRLRRIPLAGLSAGERRFFLIPRITVVR